MNFEYWKLLAQSLEQTLIKSSITWAPTCNIFNHAISCFDSRIVPEISIHNYLERINLYTECSEACFIIAYIYIRRVLKGFGFVLSKHNVHRLLLTSIVLAIKSIDDEYANNKIYAAIGGVELNELNTLEVSMLELLRYKTFVHHRSYFKTVNRLVQQYAQSEKEEVELKPLKLIGSLESLITIADTSGSN